MEDSKISNSYYLDAKAVAWLAEESAKRDRSASWYLNDIVCKLMDGKVTLRDLAKEPK